MTKRYSDTLRERASDVKQTSLSGVCPLSETERAFMRGRSFALRDTANELDSPEFSGRIVYDQRNAAQEDAKRWEAEANEWRRLCHELVEKLHGTDESWQPLTADTVLPAVGYLVLRHKDYYLRLASGHEGMWAVHGEDGYYDEEDVCECYTHYRVLRGPGET